MLPWLVSASFCAIGRGQRGFLVFPLEIQQHIIMNFNQFHKLSIKLMIDDMAD